MCVCVLVHMHRNNARVFEFKVTFNHPLVLARAHVRTHTHTLTHTHAYTHTHTKVGASIVGWAARGVVWGVHQVAVYVHVCVVVENWHRVIDLCAHASVAMADACMVCMHSCA